MDGETEGLADNYKFEIVQDKIFIVSNPLKLLYERNFKK